MVFDDSCEEVFNDKEFFKLATAGRQTKISVIYVKRKLFQKNKQSRTTSSSPELPRAKAVVTNLTDERERNMYASSKATKNVYQIKKVSKASF